MQIECWRLIEVRWFPSLFCCLALPCLVHWVPGPSASMWDELDLKIINVHDTRCLIIDEGEIKQRIQTSARRPDTNRLENHICDLNYNVNLNITSLIPKTHIAYWLSDAVCQFHIRRLPKSIGLMFEGWSSGKGLLGGPQELCFCPGLLVCMGRN